MARTLLIAALVCLIAGASLQGATLAWWRFEEGPEGANIDRNGQPDGVFYGAIQDLSGNGNHLSAWSDGDWATHTYRDDVSSGQISPGLSSNYFSVKNAGAYPGMFTDSAASEPVGIDLETIEPLAWTIEASFKPESGSWRTVVGRDSYGAADEPRLAALYFQIQPDDSVAIKFTDVSGHFHQAESAPGLIQGFDFGTDPEGETATWYHMAAVSDGATLSLYLAQEGAAYELVAQTDLTESGSPNTSLTAGEGSASGWHAGGWSVGRGLYDGGHTDRAYGYIDEVRISNSALDPAEFLFGGVRSAGVEVSTPSLQVAEGDTGVALDIWLGYEPNDPVTVWVEDISSVDQVTLSTTHVSFTTSDWNQPQSIVVTAVDDTAAEAAIHSTTLALTVTSDDDVYNGLDVDPITANVLDNECGGWGYRDADFNRDCVVDAADLQQLVATWLDCSWPDVPGCTNYR